MHVLNLIYMGERNPSFSHQGLGIQIFHDALPFQKPGFFALFDLLTMEHKMKNFSTRSHITTLLILLAYACGIRLFFFSGVVLGDDPPYAYAAVSADALDHSITEVMNQRKFAWRIPNEDVEKDEDSGPLDSLLEWIKAFFRSCGKTMGRWMRSLMDWVNKIMPETEGERGDSDETRMPHAREYLILCLILIVGILAVFLWRVWKRRQKEEIQIAERTLPATPDLRDEDIKADALPADGWLNMARDLLEKGELRMALRAFYLATLAGLAEHGMLTIAKHKSNRDYEQELHRRGHEKQDILGIFSSLRTCFDRVWYGMHEVGPEDVHKFAREQEKMMESLEA